MNEGTMTFEIGQLTFQPAPPPQAARGRAPAAPPAPAEPAVAVDVLSDMIPSSPPPDVLAAVDAAWERAAELAAQNRELHFETDKETGRVIIEVRSLDGEVLRTIPPPGMLAVMGGAEL